MIGAGTVINGLTNDQIARIRELREWNVARSPNHDGRLRKKCWFCGEWFDPEKPFDGHRTIDGELDCLNRLLWDIIDGSGTGPGDIMSFVYSPAPPTQDLDLLTEGRFILQTPTNGPAGAPNPLLVDCSRGNDTDPAAQKVIVGDGTGIWHRVYLGQGQGWTEWRRTDGVGVSGNSVVLPAPDGTQWAVTVTDGGSLQVSEVV